MNKLILLFSIGLIICTAFTKPIVPPTDYRDAFIGTYFCKSSCQVLNSDYTKLSNSINTVTIAFSKNIRDSILNITIFGRVYEVKLINQVMYPVLRNNHNQGKFFSSDSVVFSTSSGLAPNMCNFRGKKQ